jgi:hypothetical protein
MSSFVKKKKIKKKNTIIKLVITFTSGNRTYTKPISLLLTKLANSYQKVTSEITLPLHIPDVMSVRCGFSKTLKTF